MQRITSSPPKGVAYLHSVARARHCAYFFLAALTLVAAAVTASAFLVLSFVFASSFCF